MLDGLSVELLLNGAESDLDYGYDEDWSFTGIHPWGYTSTDYYLRERRTKSAEIRLLSNDESRLFAGSTDWIVGFYTLQSDESLERIYTYAGPFASDYNHDTLAIFGQLDTQLRTAGAERGLRFEEILNTMTGQCRFFT